MPSSIYESIFQQFPTVSADEWKNKIIIDLKGENFDKLIWHSKEDIKVLPFYTKENTEQYQLPIPEKQTAHWQVTERITVTDIPSANKLALHALEYGATAIVFNLQKKVFTKHDIESLLKDILTDIAPVYFENYAEENKTVLENVVKNACPVVVTIPQQDSIVDELMYALQHADSKENTVFHFHIGQNYFFEIAKLRAFRWLWKQICEKNNQQYSLFIFSETGLQRRNETDEYTNILRNTTEAMSAILGGCDSLIINSHDIEKENSDFGKRIARNVHHILNYESYFNEITDATKGSYYIEYLTYQLAKKSWEKMSEP